MNYSSSSRIEKQITDNSISQFIEKSMQSNVTDVVFIGWVWRVSIEIYSKLYREDWSSIMNKWKWDTRARVNTIEQRKENIFDNQPRAYELWVLSFEGDCDINPIV